MKKFISKLILLVIVLSMSVVSVSANVGFTDVISGGSSATLTINNVTDVSSVVLTDVAAYSDANGSNYVYVHDYQGTKSILCYKDNNDGTFTNVSIGADGVAGLPGDLNIDKVDYGNTRYNTIEVVGDKLYTFGYYKDTRDNYVVYIYSLANPEAPSLIKSFDVTALGKIGIRDFKVDGDRIYLVAINESLGKTVLQIINTTVVESGIYAGYRADYSNSANNTWCDLYGTASLTGRCAVEVLGNSIYVSGRGNDGTNTKLCVSQLVRNPETGECTLTGTRYFGQALGSTVDDRSRYVVDSVIVNGTLYVSTNMGTRGTTDDHGIFAIDVAESSNFANAVSRYNVGNNGGTTSMEYGNYFRFPGTIATDGRYLFLGDRVAGVRVFDTIGGVDLCSSNKASCAAGANVAIANGKLYTILNKADNTFKIGVCNYDVDDKNVVNADVNDTNANKVGYACDGSHVVTTLNTSGDTFKSVNKNGISYNNNKNGSSTAAYVRTLTKNNSYTQVYTVTSLADCKKDLYINFMGAATTTINVTVKVNGTEVLPKTNMTTSAGTLAKDYNVATIDLVKGTNTIQIDLDAPSANMYLGGIALKYSCSEQTDDLFFGKSDVTVDRENNVIKVNTVLESLGNTRTATVIYATYTNDHELEEVDVVPVTISGTNGTPGRAWAIGEIKLTSDASIVKRFIWEDLVNLYPYAEAEEKSIN